MIVESELREHITKTMSGEASITDLYHWLMGRTWNMHKDSEPAAIELACDVECLFFDRHDGLTDEEMIKHLHALMAAQTDHPEAQP